MNMMQGVQGGMHMQGGMQNHLMPSGMQYGMHMQGGHMPHQNQNQPMQQSMPQQH
jgi:hypothetical protein